MRLTAITVPATAAALALVLAACGSSSSGSTSTSSTQPASGQTSTSASTTTLSSADLKAISSFTHSKLGSASASATPFTIGYVNQQGGAPSFPQYTTEVKQLVSIVNSKLDGIDGHPIKLDTCFVVSSDEDGQTCGQQFAADHSIRAVLEFPLTAGSAAFHEVMDTTKIPIFGPIAASVNDATAPYGFYDTAAALTTTPVLVKYITQKLHAKRVAVIGIQGNPLSQLTTGQAVQALNAAKVTSKLALISPTSNDATAPVLAAGAQKADAIVVFVQDATQCDSVAQTLKSLSLTNKPVVTLGTCADPAVKQALGDYPKWTYLSGWPSLLAPAINSRESSEVSLVKDFYASIGNPVGAISDVEPSVQGVVQMLREINAGGGTKSTSASIVKAARADTGPMFLGPDMTAWGKIPGLKAVPNLAQRLFTYNGGGSWKDATGGWYAAAPAGGAPPAGAPPSQSSTTP